MTTPPVTEPTDKREPAQPVVHVLRCRTTGRLLAIDVGPADSSIYRLAEGLSALWPMDVEVKHPSSGLDLGANAKLED